MKNSRLKPFLFLDLDRNTNNEAWVGWGMRRQESPDPDLNFYIISGTLRHSQVKDNCVKPRQSIGNHRTSITHWQWYNTRQQSLYLRPLVRVQCRRPCQICRPQLCKLTLKFAELWGEGRLVWQCCGRSCVRAGTVLCTVDWPSLLHQPGRHCSPVRGTHTDTQTHFAHIATHNQNISNTALVCLFWRVLSVLHWAQKEHIFYYIIMKIMKIINWICLVIKMLWHSYDESNNVLALLVLHYISAAGICPCLPPVSPARL